MAIKRKGRGKTEILHDREAHTVNETQISPAFAFEPRYASAMISLTNPLEAHVVNLPQESECDG
jgi:hypothetical protein